MTRTFTATLTEPQYRALREAIDVALHDLDGRYVPFGSLYYRTKADTLARGWARLEVAWNGTGSA